MSKPKVLLIGWDAADWKLFDPLLKAGQAPTIERMINNGVMGNLATLQPVLSPMLWNSIATGKRPYKHGIHGFTEVNSHTNVVGPVLSTSRTCKAVWNMLSQEGYRTHVVNWFASHPAEKISGTCISEYYSKMPSNYEAPWSLSKEAVHPVEDFDTYVDLRLHPTELEGQNLQMFAPLLNEVDQAKDQRIKMLANLVAEALTIHNATTHILEHEEWDFVATYLGSIDHFSHAFMHYHPPQMPFVSDEDFRIYNDVLPNVYRFHDAMLARLLALAGEDATVIICSDHGFHSDHLRPHGIPLIPAGPAIWHRDQGIILMQGPDLRRDELIHGANLIDITPTILQLYGLPVGLDMDGRPLIEAFAKPQEIEAIESWDTHDGEHPSGVHPEDVTMSTEESEAVLEQFVALGYIDPMSEDKDEAAAQTIRENKWNLARAYIDGNVLHEAVPLLEELVDEKPDRRDWTMTLAASLRHMGLPEEALALTMAIVDAQDPNSFNVLLTKAELAMLENRYDEALSNLERIDTSAMDYTVNGGGAFVSRLMLLGAVYQKLRRWDEAIECYRQAAEIDEDYPRAYLGMAQCYLRTKRHTEAVDAALRAVELEHFMIPGHYVLGLALIKANMMERAIDAFLTTLGYYPQHIAAHKRLAVIYARLGHDELSQQHWLHAQQLQHQRREAEATAESSDYLEDMARRNLERAERLRPFYADLTKKEEAEAIERQQRIEALQRGEKPPEPKTFVVVSGLPRSGTSMIMQMLQAGGMEIMTDGVREADEDNPYGYLEWEGIKKIKSEPELMERAEDKITKVISMLLPSLPRKHQYKVIFLLRPIDEIVESQTKMLERRGEAGADVDQAVLAESLKRHRKEIMNALPNLPAQVLLVSYRSALENPDALAFRIASFIGEDKVPHVERMASAVRPELYRNCSEDLQAAGGES